MSNLLRSTLQNNAKQQHARNLAPGFTIRKKESHTPHKNGASRPGSSVSSPSSGAATPKSSAPWPPTSSAPSAANSVASSAYSSDAEDGGVQKKKKQRLKQDVVFSQPADTGTGSHINTQLVYAVRALKDHGNPIRLEDLSIQLGIPLDSNAELYDMFLQHDRVIHDTKTNTYSYKPDFNIRNKEQLLTEITRHYKRGGGMSVKVIRESWPSAIPAIEELAARGDVIVTRTAKDNTPRIVFFNEVPLEQGGGQIDKEFQEIWNSQKVPDEDIIMSDLQSFGQQTASVEMTPKFSGGIRKKGRKGAAKPNRRIKITNTHLNKIAGIDLTKDYVPTTAQK
ncbi:hypothetical protein DACRYDRAFT_23212 [Dacryopinax primogenitus]|uniref:TFIIE beta domain-containing protein n=1 Tax=Dacryopinax primogenitus (strain DJM 731) TaxID=1858805 RepID=M5FVD6_DACPD|nr:uncharacterized protein DACRYDRAFT_23212 [Dacryopinax primogenitus]EJU00239.1 hypothetical protein DACRYDRAFT_23212 [Dacryopinax primogenitus]